MIEQPASEFVLLSRKLLLGAGFRVTSFIVVRVLQLTRVIIFARIFVPADLGLYSLVFGIISIFSILANPGFSQYLIRKQDGSIEFTNTVFSLSIIFSLLALGLAFLSAPFLTSLFSVSLESVIRLLAILTFSIPIRFPLFLWEKALEFRPSALALIINEGFSLFVTLVLEYVYHYGVWSILIGNISGLIITGVYVWSKTVYRPKLNIMNNQVRPIMNFGFPLMIHGINGEVMTRGDNLIVGAYSGTEQLAFYNFAWQLPAFISTFTQTVDSLFYPVFAKLDHDLLATRRLFNITNKLWSISGSFLGFGILIFADQIVNIIYGANWASVIPILRVMALSFIIRFCTGYGYDNLVLVKGRTGYVMKWGIVNTLLILTVGQFMIRQMGPIGGAWFWVAQAVLLNPLVRFPLFFQELGTLEFLKHVWQPLASGIIASFVSYVTSTLLGLNILSVTIIALIVYCLVYTSILLILDRQLRADGLKLIRIFSSQT